MFARAVSKTGQGALFRFYSGGKVQVLPGSKFCLTQNRWPLRMRLMSDFEAFIYLAEPLTCPISSSFLMSSTQPRTGFLSSPTPEAEYAFLTKILDHRNVWIVYPRNFGNSDFIDSFDDQSMADDLARFMYHNKISTAAVGGHGVGGLLALKAASRHHTRVTGYFGLDTAPVNYNNFDAFQEVKSAFQAIRDLNTGKPRAAILNDINKAITVGLFHSRT